MITYRQVYVIYLPPSPITHIPETDEIYLIGKSYSSSIKVTTNP